MPIIKSISGIRGTIGNRSGEDLTLDDIHSFVQSFIILLSKEFKNIKIVVGRDARQSGELIKNEIIQTLLNLGVEVIDLDLATTPTVEMLVIKYQAQGGIIITASHNPKEWNALKFLNNKGEFLSAEKGKELVKQAEQKMDYISQKKGILIEDTEALDCHIDKILELDLVDVDNIRKKGFKILVDGINSVGGMAVPRLLQKLGIEEVKEINCLPDGNFAHNPEPIEKNLITTMKAVVESKVDLGVVVDPDVDRLVFIDEQGQMFGEEYSLVAIAQYVLDNYSSGEYNKTTVSNLSSSRALRDITEKQGGKYYSVAVGEVNVVEEMKKRKAIIGGEGNGGIIYPLLHYGRDALVGLALFLSFLVRKNIKVSDLRKELPEYYMFKDRVEIDRDLDIQKIFQVIKERYKEEQIIDIDGLKIEWKDSWVHIRVSNTEPILRIYAEAKTKDLVEKKIIEIKDILANIK